MSLEWLRIALGVLILANVLPMAASAFAWVDAPRHVRGREARETFAEMWIAQMLVVIPMLVIGLGGLLIAGW